MRTATILSRKGLRGFVLLSSVLASATFLLATILVPERVNGRIELARAAVTSSNPVTLAMVVSAAMLAAAVFSLCMEARASGRLRRVVVSAHVVVAVLSSVVMLATVPIGFQNTCIDRRLGTMKVAESLGTRCSFREQVYLYDFILAGRVPD